MAQPHLLPIWLFDRPLRFFMRDRRDWALVRWGYGGCHQGDPAFWLIDVERRRRLAQYRREPTSAWVVEVIDADGLTVVWSQAFPLGGLDVEDAARTEVMRQLAALPLEMSVMDAEAWERIHANAAPGV